MSKIRKHKKVFGYSEGEIVHEYNKLHQADGISIQVRNEDK